MTRLRVALLSLTPIYGNISGNLSLVDGHVRRLQTQGVELVVFPEMSLIGYGRAPEIISQAQPEDGFATRQLRAIASAHGVAVVAGLPLKDAALAKPYISQVFCMPDGTCTIYHKTHLRRSEQEVFSAGNELGLVSWRSLVFGLQLCYDTHFPEMSLAQASHGAQILLMSFASPMDTPETLRIRWLRFLPARAYDSNCFVLACNQAGKSSDGKYFASVILAINPDGEIIGESCSTDSGEVIVDLDLSLVQVARQRRKYLQQRRPELYQFMNIHPE